MMVKLFPRTNIHLCKICNFKCELGVLLVLLFDSLVPSGCSDHEFKCKSNGCIPKEWMCDKEEDCPDGSDEEINCIPNCNPAFWQCNDGTCINKEWNCDGEMDCNDESDENDCSEFNYGYPLY